MCLPGILTFAGLSSCYIEYIKIQSHSTLRIVFCCKNIKSELLKLLKLKETYWTFILLNDFLKMLEIGQVVNSKIISAQR